MCLRVKVFIYIYIKVKVGEAGGNWNLTLASFAPRDCYYVKPFKTFSKIKTAH